MRIPGAYNRPVVCHARSAPTAANGAIDAQLRAVGRARLDEPPRLGQGAVDASGDDVEVVGQGASRLHA